MNKGSIILICLVSMTLTKELRYEDVIEKTVGRLRDGEYHEAIEMLNLLEPYFDDDVLAKGQIAEVMFLKGTSYHGLRDVENALEQYQKAVQLQNDLPGAWKNMALIYKDTDRIEEAKNMYSEALTLQPNDPSILNCLGALMNHAKRYDEALPYLECALSNMDRVQDDEVDPASLTEDYQSPLRFVMMGCAHTHFRRTEEERRARKGNEEQLFFNFLDIKHNSFLNEKDRFE